MLACWNSWSEARCEGMRARATGRGSGWTRERERRSPCLCPGMPSSARKACGGRRGRGKGTTRGWSWTKSRRREH
eukprot:1992655-Rhodomonas_salina.1